VRRIKNLGDEDRLGRQVFLTSPERAGCHSQRRRRTVRASPRRPFEETSGNSPDIGGRFLEMARRDRSRISSVNRVSTLVRRSRLPSSPAGEAPPGRTGFATSRPNEVVGRYSSPTLAFNVSNPTRSPKMACEQCEPIFGFTQAQLNRRRQPGSNPVQPQHGRPRSQGGDPDSVSRCREAKCVRL
jgi:hypothetical protein